VLLDLEGTLKEEFRLSKRQAISSKQNTASSWHFAFALAFGKVAPMSKSLFETPGLFFPFIFSLLMLYVGQYSHWSRVFPKRLLKVSCALD
jgi:hypothetical protein